MLYSPPARANPSPLPADGFSSEHGVTFETSILDKFEVAFGREGETLSLCCTVIIYPTIKMYQPEVVWYRNCKCLDTDPTTTRCVPLYTCYP